MSGIRLWDFSKPAGETATARRPEMATLDTSNRHVLDRREGGRKISYLVPGRTRKEMEPYLATHEFLIKLVDRETVDVKFFQGYVRAYTEAPPGEN